MASWSTSLKTAGALALSTARLFARLLYMLSTPLRWVLHYASAALVFLLSPVWFISRLGLGAMSFALNMISRLQYLYIYLACGAIIGACAGFMLHGTSSFIFVLLGMDTASEQRKLRSQQYPRSLPTSEFSLVGDDKDRNEDSGSSTSWRRLDGKQHVTEVDPTDLFEKRWKLLRTPEQPRRRRKSLLAQTIHEESSESDF